MPVFLSKKNTESVFISSYYRIPFRPKKYKVVTILHDLIAWENVSKTPSRKFRNFFLRFIIRRSCRNSDLIICVSQYTKTQAFIHMKEVRNRKIVVVNNGISDVFEDINLTRNISSAIYIGSREGYKNFSHALLICYYANIQSIHIIGGGSLRHDEKDLLKVLGISYTSLIEIEEEELARLYSTETCLIYPSTDEGFGIPIYEAIKCGCPAIVLKGAKWHQSLKSPLKIEVDLWTDLNYGMGILNVIEDLANSRIEPNNEIITWRENYQLIISEILKNVKTE